MSKIGYMGIEGSFSEIAAEKLAKQTGLTNAEYVPMTNAQNILQALQEKNIAYGVLAVRNSSVGPVSEFVETFQNISYEILGEYTLPIHHCLFKKSTDIPIKQLTSVASHPQALAQTRQNRGKNYPSLIEQYAADTALAAQWLACGKLPEDTAIICSEKGGNLWGLDLIARNIEDSDENHTIFWLLKLTK